MSHEDLRQLRLKYQEVFIAPQAAREFTNAQLTPHIAGVLQVISDQKEGWVAALMKRKNDFPPATRARVPLRALLCVEVVTEQLKNFFYDLSRSRYDPAHPEMFITLFDTAQGMSRALRLLEGALVELLGETDYRERLVTGDASGFAREPQDEFAWAKTVVSATDVLAEDPSGFALLDVAVAEVHTDFDSDPNGYLQIVGAEAAQKVYKALYPLTEEITQALPASPPAKEEVVSTGPVTIESVRQKHMQIIPDPQFVQAFEMKYVSPEVTRLLTDIRNDPESIRKLIRKAKSALTAQTGDPAPSRSLLAYYFLLDPFARSFNLAARDVYDPDKPELFICFFDTAYGIEQAMYLWHGVFLELSGQTNYRERLKVDPLCTADPPLFVVTDAVNEYVRAKEVVAAFEKLAQDPSGFSLLDEVIAEIQKDFKQSRTGNLIIAGAQISRQVYKALYPLTEGI